jgi:serine/threonine protein kinase
MNLLLSSINHHHHYPHQQIYMENNHCTKKNCIIKKAASNSIEQLKKLDVNNNNYDDDDDDDDDDRRNVNEKEEDVVDDDATFLNFSSYLNRNLSEKEMRDQFYKEYVLGAKIGEGGFGVIFSALRRKDNRPVAVKVIKKSKVSQWYEFDKDKLNKTNATTSQDMSGGKLNEEHSDDVTMSPLPARIPLEIALMIRVRHVENCIEILDYLEQKSCFIIVMERFETCKDLFDFITEKTAANSTNTSGLSEALCRSYFRQIVEAIQAIHALGVVHRDIKDENILVDVATNRLKLIDFGAGAFFTPTTKKSKNTKDEQSTLNSSLRFTDFHGTRVYSPPEWILQQCYYGDRAAVWSLGVLLFNMIYGDIPWEEDSDIVNCRLYSKKNFEYNSSNSTSDNDEEEADTGLHINQVDDLIRKCLHINQNERIKLEHILKHKWFDVKTTTTATTMTSAKNHGRKSF